MIDIFHVRYVAVHHRSIRLWAYCSDCAIYWSFLWVIGWCSWAFAWVCCSFSGSLYYIVFFVLISSSLDNLSEAQRKNSEKMFDVRLVNVLSRAGFTAEKLEDVDRPAKMATVAEIITAGGKFKPKQNRKFWKHVEWLVKVVNRWDMNGFRRISMFRSWYGGLKCKIWKKLILPFDMQLIL